MMLEGLGDPSGGFGGLSFLRLPLKVKNEDTTSKVKEARLQLNPAINNPKAITGTDADLRRLTKV